MTPSASPSSATGGSSWPRAIARPAAPVCSGSSSAEASTRRSARTGSRVLRRRSCPPPSRSVPRRSTWWAPRRPSAGGTSRSRVFEQVPLVQPVARGVTLPDLTPRRRTRTLIPTATAPPVLSPDGRLDRVRRRRRRCAGAVRGRGGRAAVAAALPRSPFEDGSVVLGIGARVVAGRAAARLRDVGAPPAPRRSPSSGRTAAGCRTVARGIGPSWGPGPAARVHGGRRGSDPRRRRRYEPGACAIRWWPQWSPRGDLILLGPTLVRPDGTVAGEVSLGWPSWKPDGTALVGLDGRKIVAIDVARMRSRTVVTAGVDMRSPTWSRDGRWIAYIRYVGVYQLVIVDARTGRRVLAWRTPGRTFAGTIPVWGRVGVYVGVS